MPFRRRKSRWERLTERARTRTAGTKRKPMAKRAMTVAGGAASLLAASAATSSMRHEHR